ncbi:MAG TPA: GTPase ObgE [Abditibacteriaceae bacterium]|jgi:GTP-binding protein
MFIDEATIEVKGGDGGDGIVAFRREKFDPFGGPSGGDGGDGGDVTLRAHPHVKTLLDLSRRRHHRGVRGQHGEGGRKKGSDGAGVTLNVPVGTQVFDADTGELLVDLLIPEQEFIVAHGGVGGMGNPRFVSNTRQAPRFAEKGQKGQERRLKLALKILADVALIGLPNAGKSTLISRLSAARPKIADYPFTTLVPNLGAVRLDAESQYIVADIPGLIRGASKGAGLGHQFLKHIERAPVFVHLVDVSGPMMGGPSLWRAYASLNRELRLWQPELVERPQVVALNKTDVIAGDEECMAQMEAFRAKLVARGCEVFEISAATGENVEALSWRVFHLIKEARESMQHPELVAETKVTRLAVDAPFEIKEIARYADGMSEWEAKGGLLDRLLSRFDVSNYEAIMYIHSALQKHGVLEQMKNAGVKPGDLVHAGETAFTFEE